MRNKEEGFTLVEVMVTLVIVIIAAALVVPSISSFFGNLQLKTAARGLFADLNYAKIAAMKTLVPHTLVLGGRNGGQQKWIVFKDKNDNGVYDNNDDGVIDPADEQIVKESSLENGITLPANTIGTPGKPITFDRNGLLNRGNNTYTLQNTQNNKTIKLVVSLAGFIRIE